MYKYGLYFFKGNYLEFQKKYVRKILKSMKEASILKEKESKYFNSYENNNSSQINLIMDPLSDSIRKQLNKSIQISAEGISLLKQLHKQVKYYNLKK